MQNTFGIHTKYKIHCMYFKYVFEILLIYFRFLVSYYVFYASSINAKPVFHRV
jgi:hypothetical protein